MAFLLPFGGNGVHLFPFLPFHCKHQTPLALYFIARLFDSPHHFHLSNSFPVSHFLEHHWFTYASRLSNSEPLSASAFIPTLALASLLITFEPPYFSNFSEHLDPLSLLLSVRYRLFELTESPFLVSL